MTEHPWATPMGPQVGQTELDEDCLDDLECTHCGGEGTCEDGCDPLWYDDIHTCHACGGTGNRRDQRIF
jgi:hypothetical protein